MEDEDVKNKEECEESLVTDEKSKNFNSSFKVILVSFLTLFIIFVVAIGIVVFNKSKTLYIPSYDVTCIYKSKFNKIICTQIGDVVPSWLDIDNTPFMSYFVGDSVYTMNLVFAHSNRDYKVLRMTDKVFIEDRNRKFIYELKEQTYGDWLDFKKYAETGSVGNWGSIVLYCSENKLDEDICKKMKRNHK